MNNNKKQYFLINMFAKANGKNAFVAYRIKEISLSACFISFYLVKKKGNKYNYYKISEKKYYDCCIDGIIDILETKGYVNIGKIERQKGAVRKRFIYK
ncbi:MAG TPA: hypothetical protein PKY25_03450 [Bacilli bacterium]|nr:hypothetical protein [Bacilli bacterium]